MEHNFWRWSESQIVTQQERFNFLSFLSVFFPEYPLGGKKKSVIKQSQGVYLRPWPSSCKGKEMVIY